MDTPDHPYDTLAEAFAVNRFPPDLVACYLWIAGTILSVYLPVISETPLRVLMGIPFVLFVPGYALIAALFPKKDDIDGIERIALSFGLSIAVVPLTGLALNYTPWGIRLTPVVLSLSLITLLLCLAAQYRRARLRENERFAVPFTAIRTAIAAEFFPGTGSSRTDRILSALLLIVIVAAVATTVYVIVVPKEGEKFTEFFILGEKGMAADYPDRLFTGQNGTVIIGIGNHEYRTITYTVETYLLKMDFNEKTNTSSLSAMDRLDRFTVAVPHNETVLRPYTFAPAKAGYNRIEFLLFNETVSPDRIRGMDRINASYRDLHLWLTIRQR